MPFSLLLSKMLVMQYNERLCKREMYRERQTLKDSLPCLAVVRLISLSEPRRDNKALPPVPS